MCVNPIWNHMRPWFCRWCFVHPRRWDSQMGLVPSHSQPTSLPGRSNGLSEWSWSLLGGMTAKMLTGQTILLDRFGGSSCRDTRCIFSANSGGFNPAMFQCWIQCAVRPVTRWTTWAGVNLPSQAVLFKKSFLFLSWASSLSMENCHPSRTKDGWSLKLYTPGYFYGLE